MNDLFDMNTAVEHSDTKNPLLPPGATRTLTNLRFQLRPFKRSALVAVILLVLAVAALAGAVDPILVGSWPGYSRGSAVSVSVSGNYAYVADEEGGIRVFDVSQPAHVVQVGGLDTDPTPSAISTSGARAYMVGQNLGLQIFDASVPANPSRLGTYDTTNGPSALVIRDSIAYVVSSAIGLEVVDVSDPRAPLRVGQAPFPFLGRGVFESFGATLLGDVLYVVAGFNGILAFDVTNPTSPRLMGSPGSVSDSGYAVAARGGNLYVVGPAYDGADSPGLRVYDVSSVAQPVRVAKLQLTANGAGFAVVAEGHYIYVAGRPFGMLVVDVQDPTHPQVVGSYPLPDGARALAIQGNYVYLAPGREGWWLRGSVALEVLDVSDPTRPVKVGSAGSRSSSTRIAVAVNHAYVGEGSSGLRVLDVKDPTRPKWVNSTHPITNHITSITVEGSHLYVGQLDSWVSGVRQYDLSTPDSPVAGPVFLTSTNSGFDQYISDIAVRDPYVYAVDPLQVWVLDASRPGELNYVSRPKQQGLNLRQIALGTNRAYIAIFAGLLSADLSDPAHPVLPYEENWIGGDFRNCIAVREPYVYSNDSSNGLEIVDFSDEQHPRRAGYLPTHESGYDLQLVGNLAYWAGGQEGLRVIDIHDPANPVDIGRYDSPGSASGVKVVGNYAYLADGEWGLQVLRLGITTNSPPEIIPESVALSDAGALEFVVVGPPGKSVRVQSSVDLTQWESEGVLENPAGSVRVVAPVPRSTRRFFRVSAPERVNP